MGAIAELVRDDGAVMRLPEAEALAEETGLVVLTVADLVAWRRAHDPGVLARIAEAGRSLPTRHGDFRVVAYRDLRSGAEHLALTPVARSDGPRAPPRTAGWSGCTRSA